jgi:predicted O-methyltransferase YrrM
MGLRDENVKNVLDKLHRSAKADKFKILQILPGILFGLIRGKTLDQTISDSKTKDIYLPVSREEGKLMYEIARATCAKNIVEFGTSFGISSIYLASAIKDNGGGVLIGTEIEPYKHEQAVNNIAEAGLSEFADIRLGDALKTLEQTLVPIDMIFLDGWKNLYMPILEKLKPRLRVGSVVLADNIFTFKKTLKPYVDYMQSGDNGFESTTLKISEGLEFSVYTEERQSGYRDRDAHR